MTFSYSHTIEITNKPGRNDPCPCGSGKKYKKCCLSRGSEYSPQKKESIIERIVTYLTQFDWYQNIMNELSEEWYPDGIPDEDAFITVGETAIYEGVYQGASPLAYFIQHDTTLSDSERELYTRWLVDGIFSFFTVEQSTPGSHLSIRDVKSNKQYTLFDHTASYRLTKGVLFAGRILPFKDNWIGSGTLTPFPAEYQYSIHRAVSHDTTHWSQRELMSILHRRGRLGNVNEMSISDLKRKIASYTENDAQYKALLRTIENCEENGMLNALSHLSHLPPDKIDEVSTYIQSLCNRFLKIPSHLEPGPKEAELIQMALHEISSQQDILKSSTGHELDVWLDTVQIELDGKTPRDVIIAERKSRGNTNMDVSYIQRVVKMTPMQKGYYDQGVDALKAEEYISAIRCFSQVDPEHELGENSFRWYNNVGICFMRLGYMNTAKQYFTHCTHLNPQYDVAKTNLKNFQNDTLIKEVQEYGEEIRFRQSLQLTKPFKLTQTPQIVSLLRHFISYVHNRKMISLTLVGRQIPFKDASALNALFPNPDTFPPNVKPNSGDGERLPQLCFLYRLVTGTYFIKVRLNRLSLTKVGIEAMAWGDYVLWHELLIVVSTMRDLPSLIEFFATHPQVRDLTELNTILFPFLRDSAVSKDFPVFESDLLRCLTMFRLIERDPREGELQAYRATDTLRQLHAGITQVIDDAIPRRMFTRFS